MYPGLTFGFMVFVALGTAIYYFMQGPGPENAHSNSNGRRTRDDGRRNNQPVPVKTEYGPSLHLKRRRRRSGSPPDQCTICCDELIGQKSLRVLTCGHEFHNMCLGNWLQTGSGTCPVCRKEVTD